MCIAVYCPKGKRITQETFFECWNSNDDGGGFMYVKNGLQIVKEVDDPAKLWMQYKNALKIAASPFVLHFRIATSGKVNKENCHPFKVNDGLAVVHNGMIDIKIKAKSLSDTVHFTKLLRRLPRNFLNKGWARELISGYCSGSKLVFLSSAGEVEIINEHLGKWDSGVWFSNNSYKPLVSRTVYTFPTYQAYQGDESSEEIGVCLECYSPLAGDEVKVCKYCATDPTAFGNLPKFFD